MSIESRPPRPPRFVLPVGGAKVGSIARPVADGTVAAIGRAATAKSRFGMRSNTRTLASLGRPTITPEGSLTDLELPDGEVG